MILHKYKRPEIKTIKRIRSAVFFIIVLNPFLNSRHCIISIYLIYTAKISINV